MIQQTSIEAFQKVMPKINFRQEMVLEHLYWVGEATDAMIGASIKLPINCITPRRGELVKKKLIEKSRVDICLCTHGTATYWKITQKGREVMEFRRRKCQNQ
jgi:hypothetical protein